MNAEEIHIFTMSLIVWKLRLYKRSTSKSKPPFNSLQINDYPELIRVTNKSILQVINKEKVARMFTPPLNCIHYSKRSKYFKDKDMVVWFKEENYNTLGHLG